MPIEYFEARERALLGPRFAELYAPPEAEAARGVTVSALRMTPEVFAAGADFAVEPSPFCRAGFLVRQPDFRPGRHPWHHAGVFYSQEPSASSAAPLLGVQPGMRVLDLCAAPGGKTLTIAQEMGDRGRLVSCDVTEKRVGLIRAAAARMGLGCIETRCNDAAVYDPALPAADRVLADVPCSGLGIIRKKPDIRYKDLSSLGELPKVQLRLMETLCSYVKPGGALLYSTCTILRRENEDVVRAFLAGHSDFYLEPMSLPAPLKQNNGMQLLLPEQYDTDGFFIAKLRRAP